MALQITLLVNMFLLFDALQQRNPLEDSLADCMILRLLGELDGILG